MGALHAHGRVARGYGAGLFRLEPPTFLESQWRDREAGDPLIVGALNNWRNAA